MKKSIRTNKNELRISISKVINFALYFIKYICCVRLTRRNDFINGFATIQSPRVTNADYVLRNQWKKMNEET